MQGYNLVITLGIGSLLAFSLFFIYFKILHWGGKIAALATAASMLLIYVPLAITHWSGLDVFAIHFAFFMMIPYGMGIITGVHEERRARDGEDSVKKGIHAIPASIIVFFILLAVVDSVIISFATGGLGGGLAQLLLPESKSEDIGEKISSRFTGAVSNDMQDEERQFDAYVEKLKKQKARGWKITGGWNNTPEVNKTETFHLNVKDKLGREIEGAQVSVEFRRSSDMSFDLPIILEETEKGRYAKAVQLPLVGCWSMKILIIKNDDEHEIKGETEIATRVEGKLILPKCADGEPDIEQKRAR